MGTACLSHRVYSPRSSHSSLCTSCFCLLLSLLHFLLLSLLLSALFLLVLRLPSKGRACTQQDSSFCLQPAKCIGSLSHAYDTLHVLTSHVRRETFCRCCWSICRVAVVVVAAAVIFVRLPIRIELCVLCGLALAHISCIRS